MKSHIKQTATLPPTMAALFLESLAHQVRDNQLSIQVFQEDGDALVKYSPFLRVAAGDALNDEFFIGLVEVLLTELRGEGAK